MTLRRTARIEAIPDDIEFIDSRLSQMLSLANSFPRVARRVANHVGRTPNLEKLVRNQIRKQTIPKHLAREEDEQDQSVTLASGNLRHQRSFLTWTSFTFQQHR